MFERDDKELAGLYAALSAADRATVVFWALAAAVRPAERLEELCPALSGRAHAAISAATAWAAGEIKMREARTFILDCHAAAKVTADREAQALFHAVGQACSTVHTARHAPGLYMYELTAYVLRYGADNCADAVARRIEEYARLLEGAALKAKDDTCKRAEFLKN